MTGKISDNVMKVREAVEAAARASGRNLSEIGIMAATKYTDRAGVEELLRSGIALIGENRVQDAVSKLAESGDGSQKDIHADFPQCKVHMIGQLQTNKVNAALKLFDLVETVDRISLADALEKRLDRILPVLVEVKLTGEESKTGCPQDEIPALIEHIQKNCSHLSLRGFMGMGPWDPDPETARPFYRELKGLFDKYGPQIDGFDTLSMGMSGDFEVAIQEGATLIRIGRAFFE
jgi:pyridoxal phosphate enzyme (YggS family)